MKRSVFAVRNLSFMLSVLLIAGMAHAQYRASIQGVVTDAQGAVVPGATVTLTDKDTNRTLTAISDDGGIYNFAGLGPDRYSLKAEKSGFKTKTIDDLKIIAEQSNGVNIQLEVGASNETVTVNGAEVPAIDTQTAQISGTITSNEVQKLPSFGRDIFQLAQLAPGVFGDGSRSASGDTQAQPGNAGPGGSGGSSGVFSTENRAQISAGGGRQDANNVTLDGVGITSVSWGGAAIVTPNEDSVKEVKVVSNSYDAENGRFAGAQIQVISKTGSNQYHGSFFFKADRPGLNSYQAWTGPAGNPQTPQRNTNRFNDWGGSVSGPIIKNKLFGFFAYERIANSSTVTGQQWFETPQLLALAPAGSIAAQYAAYPGESPKISGVVDQTCASIGLVDGTNCHMIAGQGLDIGRPLDPTLFPLGTMDPSFVNNLNPGLGGDGTGDPANLDGIPDIMNANTIGPNTNTNQQFNFRVDYNATSKDLVSVNMYRVPVTSLSYNGFRSANLFNHHAVNEAETAIWDHTFSPSTLNELRVNAAGWRWNELKSNPQIPLGLPQTGGIGDPGAGNQIGTVCPGCNALGGPAGSIFDQWTYNLKDVVTKVHGSHTMKFGGEVTKLHFVQDAPWSARPNFFFDNYWNFLNDAPYLESGTFNPQTGAPTDVRKDSRATILGFFAQDDWKLKPNLTVNLGLRWEYFGPISFIKNQLSTPVLGSGANVLTDLKMRVGGNLYNADKNDFGPQIGFAWSPYKFNQKLVLRGGFGVGYTGEEQAITLNIWTNLPFTNGNSNLTGSNIVYAIPSDPHTFLPYPTNPNAVLNLDPATNLPAVGSGVTVGVTGVPQNFATGRTYHYSMEAQADLGSQWVGTIGYQGSQSRHLTRQYNLNQIYGAQGVALNPVVTDVDWYAHDANGHFNALLTELQHRFVHSFQMDMQYRYAKGRDNESGPYATSNYVWNANADMGPSDYDVTHAFKLYGIYSPTFFHGDHNWIEKVAGGWSFSGILNAHSGFPWSPVFNGSCNIIYSNGACYPNNGGNTQLLPAAYLGGAKNSYSNNTFLSAGGNFPNGGASYFTAPTFTDCTLPYPQTCPAPQQPAPLRNAFRGPRYFDVDATISKSFGLPTMPVLGEGANIEFRVNFYNLMNSLNLTGVDNTITDPHFGQATGALGGRTIEMQARFNF
jgi:hypothetical protein